MQKIYFCIEVTVRDVKFAQILLPNLQCKAGGLAGAQVGCNQFIISFQGSHTAKDYPETQYYLSVSVREYLYVLY